MSNCPECGAIWLDEKTCQDYFHQMLFWEAEYPELGEVHHLMVLGYHLQHPSLYSPEGLVEGLRLLSAFIEGGLNTHNARKQNQAPLDSSNRKWKIKGTPGAHAAYPRQVSWTLTAADVAAGGAENYCENVKQWAQSILTYARKAGI